MQMSSKLRFKNKIVTISEKNMISKLDDLGKEGYEIKAAAGIYVFLQKQMTQLEVEAQEQILNQV